LWAYDRGGHLVGVAVQTYTNKDYGTRTATEVRLLGTTPFGLPALGNGLSSATTMYGGVLRANVPGQGGIKTSPGEQTSVNDEVLAVDPGVTEEKVCCIRHFLHRDQPSEGGALYVRMIHHVSPLRTVANNPRVQGIDPIGRKLECQSPYERTVIPPLKAETMVDPG
jgi:hypothetical protein